MRWHIFVMVFLFLSGVASLGLALDMASVVGMWLFDDSKDIAKDYSGNGNNGNLISDPEWVKEGKFGGALKFEFAKANNVRAPIPHNDTITIAAWGQYNELPTTNIGLIHVQEGDFENADPGSKTIGIWVENTGMLWGRIIPAGGGNVNFPKNEKLEPDKWYHIAMVIDADTKKATQYVDGKEVGQVDYPGTLTHYDFINIGRQGNETWEGMIDEVVVFNTALSTAELKALMNGASKGFSVELTSKLATTWGGLRAFQGGY